MGNGAGAVVDPRSLIAQFNAARLAGGGAAMAAPVVQATTPIPGTPPGPAGGIPLQVAAMGPLAIANFLAGVGPPPTPQAAGAPGSIGQPQIGLGIGWGLPMAQSASGQMVPNLFGQTPQPINPAFFAQPPGAGFAPPVVPPWLAGMPTAAIQQAMAYMQSAGINPATASLQVIDRGPLYIQSQIVGGTEGRALPFAGAEMASLGGAEEGNLGISGARAGFEGDFGLGPGLDGDSIEDLIDRESARLMRELESADAFAGLPAGAPWTDASTFEGMGPASGGATLPALLPMGVPPALAGLLGGGLLDGGLPGPAADHPGQACCASCATGEGPCEGPSPAEGPALGTLGMGATGGPQAEWQPTPFAAGCRGGGSGSYLIVVTATSAYNARTSDGFIKADASSGSFTVTLPPAASAGAGKVITIKKIDSSTNLVTIDGSSAETIDDLADLVLRRQYETVTLVCDGSEWWIQSHST